MLQKFHFLLEWFLLPPPYTVAIFMPTIEPPYKGDYGRFFKKEVREGHFGAVLKGHFGAVYNARYLRTFCVCAMRRICVRSHSRKCLTGGLLKGVSQMFEHPFNLFYFVLCTCTTVLVLLFLFYVYIYIGRAPLFKSLFYVLTV